MSRDLFSKTTRNEFREALVGYTLRDIDRTFDAGNFSPRAKGESLENYRKVILEGLQRQISGLCEVANKASDRHARRYNPAPHHARLAVNAAFKICEFLLESCEYQQKKEQRRAP